MIVPTSNNPEDKCTTTCRTVAVKGIIVKDNIVIS
jgi:hypothetical protein